MPCFGTSCPFPGRPKSWLFLFYSLGPLAVGLGCVPLVTSPPPPDTLLPSSIKALNLERQCAVPAGGLPRLMQTSRLSRPRGGLGQELTACWQASGGHSSSLEEKGDTFLLAALYVHTAIWRPQAHFTHRCACQGCLQRSLTPHRIQCQVAELPRSPQRTGSFIPRVSTWPHCSYYGSPVVPLSPHVYTHIKIHAYTCTCMQAHMHTRVHTPTHIRVYTHTHACMCVNTNINACIYTPACRRAHAHTYVHVNTCTHRRTHTCTHINTYTCAHTRMYTHIHTHMYA